MKRPTHMLYVNNAAGTSYARSIAKNVPKSEAGCTCGGKLCGPKPTPKRGRRMTTEELVALRKRFLAEAQHETGAARRASLGTAADIQDVIDRRGDGPFSFVEDVLVGPADSSTGAG